MSEVGLASDASESDGDESSKTSQNTASLVLQQGITLGRFALDKRLAMGGMAEIWLAHDSMTSKACALKVLLPELSSDPAIRTMFMDEVRLTMRLKHRNIVRVDGVFEVEDYFFQAMEVLEGKDVRRLLSQCVQSDEAFPVSVALVIGASVAKALAYAHDLKSESGVPLEIVHRDISPHNIMLCSDGTVKVLDFGIARAKERATKTAQGVIKGKLAYMAPEQAIAQPVTHKADIFSLGIVLWEMLAMRRLFFGSSDAETLALVCEAQIPPLQEFRDDVPAELSELIVQMLQLKPDNRPADMRTVENRLKKVIHQFEPSVVDDDSIREWATSYLSERPATKVQPARPSNDSGPKATRAENHLVQGHRVAERSDEQKTVAHTLSSFEEAPRTEAIDLSSMNQTLQEPDETDLVEAPFQDEIRDALEQDQTFELPPNVPEVETMMETEQGDQTNSSFLVASPSEINQKKPEFGGDIREHEANRVDLHAQTALYSDTKVKRLEQPEFPQGNSQLENGSLPTASGPLVIEKNTPENPNSGHAPANKAKRKLFWAKLFLVGGILVFFYALFIQDS